ncbi:MAG: SDR family NAD(P)-dependent oxidoreductase [candidate division KSB1 bacterium]|nr:SDR family NAD(P)-dependent oxidoreductase [candidate division KSB1 bacterium]MDZ7301137.1 SDR family NAD(P)-dependent oxidoreductase [candidate division KSB1 bacterium]MDZ7311979.1 SDR family NAD(P)-dependent oxidoreductase [candidate division KSB1 bacterium]
MELDNKIALVTGAGRGIGRAIALALAKAGAKLALAARNQHELESVAQEIQKLNTEALVLPTDLRDEMQTRRMVMKTVEQFGALHILVNNAGLGYFRSVAEMTTAEWDEMFAVNMRAIFIATNEAIPHLRKAGESFVINIASLAGKNTFVNGGGYTATKWAVRAFSQCLMLEERKNGMRVLVVCPGSVDTSFATRSSGSPHSGKKEIVRPEDVAETIVMSIKMPQRTMVSEIDIRPSNP